MGVKRENLETSSGVFYHLLYLIICLLGEKKEGLNKKNRKNRGEREERSRERRNEEENKVLGNLLA